MSTINVPISTASYQLLSRIADETGQPPDVVLDRALAEFGRRIALPQASAQAEILEDCGRITVPPRGATAVTAAIVAGGRPAPRLRHEED